MRRMIFAAIAAAAAFLAAPNGATPALAASAPAEAVTLDPHGALKHTLAATGEYTRRRYRRYRYYRPRYYRPRYGFYRRYYRPRYYNYRRPYYRRYYY